MQVRSLAGMVLLFAVAACDAPRDIAYCERLGVTPTHSDYGQCLDYFEAQEEWFFADRQVCNRKADETYPHTLYDRGRYDYVQGTFGVSRFGSGIGVGLGPYSGGRIVSLPPDRRKNQLVDDLRLRILKPCMQEKGWRSPHTWELGRFNDPEVKKPNFTPRPRPPVQSKSKNLGASNLPWLNEKAVR